MPPTSRPIAVLLMAMGGPDCLENVEPFLLANPRVMYRMLQTEARRVRTTDELRI